MNYSLLIFAFLLLFGYEGSSVITILDFMGYIMLFVALRQLALNKYFKIGMYFALGNGILWLIVFYLTFLFNDSTPQATLDLFAHMYVWGSYVVFAGSIICTMLGIWSEASEFKLKWLERLSIIMLVVWLIESLVLNAVVFVLQWKVLVPMQMIVVLINGLLITTTIFARFNIQRKDLKSKI